MIIYLASYPRSGNTLARQLIWHYFRRLSSSVYSEDDRYMRFEGDQVVESDADERFLQVHISNSHSYRVLAENSQGVLTPEFRKNLAASSEVFFVKTHEHPFDTYFEGEYVLRIVRHPGASLWSYYNFARELETLAVTVEDIISGESGSQWSHYTDAWISAERALQDSCFKVRYEELVKFEDILTHLIQEWTGFEITEPLGSFPVFEIWRQKEPKFYRSGQADEWRRKLTPDQIMLLYQRHATAAAKEGYAFDFAPPPYPVDYETRAHLARLGMVDAANMPKVEDAGHIVENGSLRYQVMFNGVKVPADSYYGTWYSELIRQCDGHHEPQEEYVFNALVKRAPEGAAMLELGSYWALYSAWFLSHVPRSRAILVEPNPENIIVSMATLSLNNCKASIELGAIGRPVGIADAITVGEANKPNFVLPQHSVDGLMKTYGIDHLYVLHSDIQGAEVVMLEGAALALAQQRIDYVVISTHSNDLHYSCLSLLAAYNYRVIAEHDTFESYTYDGLIVACADKVRDIQELEIHKRTVADWTWEQAAETWANKDDHLKKHNQMLEQAAISRALNQIRKESADVLEQILSTSVRGKQQELADQSLVLREENQQLQEGNQHLNEEIQHLNEEIQRLHQEIQRLHQESQHLHEEMARLHDLFNQRLDDLRRRKISRLMALLGKPII